jgi:hypothetical protein
MTAAFEGTTPVVSRMLNQPNKTTAGAGIAAAARAVATSGSGQFSDVATGLVLKHVRIAGQLISENQCAHYSRRPWCSRTSHGLQWNIKRRLSLFGDRLLLN